MICTRLPGYLWILGVSELCIHPKTALAVCPDHHIGLTLCQFRGWTSICCWVCGSVWDRLCVSSTKQIPAAPGEFSSSWTAVGSLTEVLLALLVKGVLLLRLWHKSYSLLLQSISVPSSGFSWRPKQSTDFDLSFYFIFFPPNPSLLA